MPRRGRPKQLGPSYSNRSDLNAVPTGRPYGERKKLEGALEAQPIQPVGPSARPDMSAMLAAAQGMSFTPVGLGAPTERPGEPVTAGLPIGPGPGPEVLSTGAGPDPVAAQLRGLFARYPNRDLAELLEDLDSGAGSF